MTRSLLSLLVCAVALCVGLATAWFQCLNHARADELDRAKRQDDLVVAGIEVLEAGILSRLYGLEQEWAEQGEQPADEAELEVPER